MPVLALMKLPLETGELSEIPVLCLLHFVVFGFDLMFLGFVTVERMHWPGIAFCREGSVRAQVFSEDGPCRSQLIRDHLPGCTGREASLRNIVWKSRTKRAS